MCIRDRNTAGWWADGTIDDGSFVSGIEWLVSNDIIQVPATAVSGSAESSIPSWIKNTAGWWADGTIDDGSFVNAIQHLIKVGIMTIPQTEQVVPEKSNVSSNADPELINESKKLKSKIDECQQKNTEADIYLCASKFKKQLADERMDKLVEKGERYLPEGYDPQNPLTDDVIRNIKGYAQGGIASLMKK